MKGVGFSFDALTQLRMSASRPERVRNLPGLAAGSSVRHGIFRQTLITVVL
jgi:hypothetical protein